MKTKIISLKDFRRNITSVWREAHKDNVRFIVMNHSKPILEVLPYKSSEIVFEETEFVSPSPSVAPPRTPARPKKAAASPFIEKFDRPDEPEKKPAFMRKKEEEEQAKKEEAHREELLKKDNRIERPAEKYGTIGELLDAQTQLQQQYPQQTAPQPQATYHAPVTPPPVQAYTPQPVTPPPVQPQYAQQTPQSQSYNNSVNSSVQNSAMNDRIQRKLEAKRRIEQLKQERLKRQQSMEDADYYKLP